jgi:hypothetical protein
MEQRHYHRVKFSGSGRLVHNDMTYRVRAENISLRGALISCDECMMIPLEETCTLSLAPDDAQPPVVITVQIVHCFFSMLGVKFVELTDEAEHLLFELIKAITPEPEKLEQEWEELLQQRNRRRIA